MRTTSLTRYAPTFREVDPDGPKKVGAAAWHEVGAVVIPVDILKTLPWQDQKFLELLAVKLYGKREKK